MTDDTTPTPAKKTAPRKTAARKPTARNKPTMVPDVGVPPLEAIDTPSLRPRKPKTNTQKRRGATAVPTPDQLVEQRRRERRAVELAAAGVSDWEEIAQVSGYESKAGAWKAVQRVLDRQEFSAAADYRHLMGYRLERIVRANWEAAISQTESPAKDKATLRLFRAFDQLRRTFGLDLEVDKIAEAFRIPEDPEERAQELIGLRDGLRSMKVVGGTDIDGPSE